MKEKGIFFLAGLLLSVLAYSQKINPARPDLSPGNFRLDSLPDSEINIPIQVNLAPLFRLAEESVDTLFTSPGYPDGWVQEGCDIRYKYIFRRSPFTIRAAGPTLYLGFTGYYKIIGSTRACVNGTIISPWTPPCRCGFGDEGERKVTVGFTASISIQPDYKVKLNIKREEPEALDKCEVCFWGQDITSQVLKGLKTELDASKALLEKDYGAIDLKPYFQQVWDQMNKVQDLYGLGWLQVNPQKVNINNIYIDKDSLNIYLGLSAKPKISFEKPIEKNSWVPRLGSFGRNRGFSIFLDAVLNYDSLSNLLNAELKGKEFDFRKAFVKKKFIIEECKIYGGGFDKLIIKINFSGTNTGAVYLTGRPAYDTATKTLQVEDVDFDIKSKNVLLSSADWLFDKKITREIKKYARFELGAYIDAAKTTINEQLNQQWMQGVSSYGAIEDISLIRIYPMQQHLVIRSNCNGQLSVKAESASITF